MALEDIASGFPGLSKNERSAYQILEDAKTELELTDKDITYISAVYVNKNLERMEVKPVNIQKRYMPTPHKTEEDLIKAHYKPAEKLVLEKITTYKMGLSKVEKERLDFQILTNVVSNKNLVKEVLFNIYEHKNEKEIAKRILKESHGTSAIDYISIPFTHFERPNGQSFMAKASGAYFYIDLGHRIDAGESSESIIEDILHNHQNHYNLD